MPDLPGKYQGAVVGAVHTESSLHAHAERAATWQWKPIRIYAVDTGLIDNRNVIADSEQPTAIRWLSNGVWTARLCVVGAPGKPTF